MTPETIAAQLLTQAAQAKGISVHMAANSEHLKAAMDTPLTDTELEAVAGGGPVAPPKGQVWKYSPNYR